MKSFVGSVMLLAIALGVGTAQNPPKGGTVKKVFEAAPAAFKTKNEKLSPSAVIAADGTVTLSNRGLLVSKKEYKKVTLRFSFQWEEGDETYPDHLCVVLRTTGRQNKEWSHEIEEGLVIRFNAAGKGTVTLEERKAGLPSQQITVKKDTAFEQSKAYAVEVTDDGKTVAVRIDGKEVIKSTAEGGPGKIGFYNREPVGGVRHVTILKKLSVE